MLWQDPSRKPEQEAEAFVNADKGVEDVTAALEGARAILMERFAEHAPLLQALRQLLWDKGWLVARVVEGKEREGQKFRDYFAYAETIRTVPSHRALALFRGRQEGVLQLSLASHNPELEPPSVDPALELVCRQLNWQHQGRAADDWLQQVLRWTWRVKLQLHMETELFRRLREEAERQAISVFAENLRDLLMAPPAGPKVTMGIDPGLRTGIKVVVVDETGKLLHHAALFPHAPQKQWQASKDRLLQWIKAYKVTLVSIGNGTASRETEKLVREVRAISDQPFESVVVSEAGASIYSASALASEEFPDLDVSYRGAVSIARRVQDPLAELVKIDPKSIGVGQYQHDVNQALLARALDAVVEDCVHAVGVDLNTASAPLLARVSGLGPGLAKSIVSWRESHGPFPSREALLQVPRLGARAFEQSAGFLRIRDGEEPLDASAVHPESYPLVRRMAESLGLDVSDLVGRPENLRKIAVEDWVAQGFGRMTVEDVLRELEKPGRDPRPVFQSVSYKEGVETLADLVPGMWLEGVVTNVTHFGAFVDIGVHQDGLVHISMLADRFVSEPRDVVKAGDIVRVCVLEVDVDRKRIALSMRSQPQEGAAKKPPQREAKSSGKAKKTASRQGGQTRKDAPASAFGDALAAALKKKKA
jgi:uncharacterized protein